MTDTVEAWVPVVAMRKQVVVCRQMQTSPNTAEPVMLVILVARFKVIGIIQGFGNDVPLRVVLSPAYTLNTSSGTPAHAAMIDDDVLAPGSAKKRRRPRSRLPCRLSGIYLPCETVSIVL